MPETPATPPPDARLRVLLVDDDRDSADVTALHLRETGHAVEVAASVDAALGALAAGDYALVVLDLVLDRDAATLHQTLARLGVPVLLVSGTSPERLPEVARTRGWGWLAKPCEPDQLAAAALRLLTRSQPARGTQPPPQPAQPLPPPAREGTPPEGTRLPARALTWPEALDRSLDALTRRALRGVVGWWIFRLQHDGRLTPEALLGLVACAVGVEAAVRAARERKAAVAAAVALPVLLAVAGELASSATLTGASGYLVALLVPLAAPLLRAH